MEAPVHGILIKITLHQPTEAAYIGVDKAMGHFTRREAVLNAASTPTLDRLGWGEYWFPYTATTATQVEQAVRQALLPLAATVQSLQVLALHESGRPGGDLTWEAGWQQLRAASRAQV